MFRRTLPFQRNISVASHLGFSGINIRDMSTAIDDSDSEPQAAHGVSRDVSQIGDMVSSSNL